RCTCNYRSTTDRGDDPGNDRNRDRALVRVRVRVRRERHARAVRSATKTRGAWAVSVRAEPDVYRRRNDPGRRGALLPVAIDPDLYRLVLSDHSPVRCVVRGADVAANFRIGLRSLLRPR